MLDLRHKGALRLWAHTANYYWWKSDVIGRIYGVGLITFQYLRMQAGVDTTVPDKIIKRSMKCYFGLYAKGDVEFIKKIEEFSNIVRYSQILICWAIWLKNAGVTNLQWEQTRDYT